MCLHLAFRTLPFDFIDEIEHMAGKQNLLASKQNLPYWTGSISRLRGCAAAEFAQSEGRNNFSTHTHILFKQSYSFSNRKRNSFECVHEIWSSWEVLITITHELSHFMFIKFICLMIRSGATFSCGGNDVQMKRS